MSKSAVITGSLGNLGSTVTRVFLGEGFHVLGFDRKESLSRAPAPTEKSLHVGVDLSDLPGTEALVGDLCPTHGPIQAAVLLAGGFAMNSLETSTMTDVQEMMAMNFETAFNATKSLLPHMAPGGRFIYMGARPSLDPAAGLQMAPYALSKSLIFQLADMVNEIGKDRKLAASVIVPSIIDTPTNREAMPDANFSDWVTTEEIAEMIRFLCSPEGASVRNTTIKMYGNS